MLGAFFKQKLAGSVNKYSGRKDFLEAACSAAALVTYADGSADDNEIEAAVKAISNNPNLSSSFNNREIEGTMDQMLKRAAGGRVGRSALMKELGDIASDHDMSETVLLTALDVADTGGISTEEQAVLDKIASALGLKVADYA